MPRRPAWQSGREHQVEFRAQRTTESPLREQSSAEVCRFTLDGHAGVWCP